MRQNGASGRILTLLLLLLGVTDGYLNGVIRRCEFNSTDPEGIQFILSYFYNKLEFLRFDSSIGLFIGYTEFGVKTAERFNNDTAILKRYRYEKYRYCAPNIDMMNRSILSKSVEPYAVINASGRVLVCSVYGFYPKEINVTWTKNHKHVHSRVFYSDLMPNSDWTYQIHSTLVYSHRSGDKISCVIEHVSLKEPMVVDYDGSLTDWERNNVIIGATGLVLGLLLPLVGFIYHKLKGDAER